MEDSSCVHLVQSARGREVVEPSFEQLHLLGNTWTRITDWIISLSASYCQRSLPTDCIVCQHALCERWITPGKVSSQSQVKHKHTHEVLNFTEINAALRSVLIKLSVSRRAPVPRVLCVCLSSRLCVS